ncbi:MAG TPA: DinB family protein [Bryobacteraceae bacterium]|nr:DinB family protein [Bryobacteraceae bacterium]
MSSQPEPWLRGTHIGTDAVYAHVLYTFKQVMEELNLHAPDLSGDETWMRPFGLGSLGFHIRHIQGSIDRLLTYAEGKPLAEEQLAQLKREHQAGGAAKELIRELDGFLENARVRVLAIPEAELNDKRVVGRLKLPTTAKGLLIHISEHTQRHLGQAVLTAKLVRELRNT